MRNSLMDILANSVSQTPGKGRDDDVPAMLSEGEYVIPADVVAMIGDGSTEAGFEALDAMIDTLRRNYRGSDERPIDNQALKGRPNAPRSNQSGNPARRGP